MQVTCSNCGAKYSLDDQQVSRHNKVQFKCKCGQTNVVAVKHAPDATQALTPLPSFARAGKGQISETTTLVNEFAGLSLPADKNITISLISGPSKGTVHTMTKPRVVLGRSGADIEVNDPGVSRWHCAVEVKDDVVRARDLDSTNGMFINDERVRVAELEHFSEFRIGATTVMVTITPKTD